MAGQKHIPHGLTVSFNSQDIGGLLDVTHPPRTRGSVDVTDNDSGGTKEFLAGLRESGEVSVEYHKIPGDAGQAALLASYNANIGSGNEEEAVVISLPGQATDDVTVTTISFDAHVTSIQTSNSRQDSDESQKEVATMRIKQGTTEATA